MAEIYVIDYDERAASWEQLHETFDDSRIENGEVSLDEMAVLKTRLVQWYKRLADSKGIPLTEMDDVEKYHLLLKKKTLFDDDEFFLLVDKDGEVQNMVPVVYHLMQEKENPVHQETAIFYAKLMQHDGYYLP